MCHTKIVNRVYTLNSSLDFYLLFENFTTYSYNIPYTCTLIFHPSIIFLMFKDTCKWDLLPLRPSYTMLLSPTQSNPTVTWYKFVGLIVAHLPSEEDLSLSRSLFGVIQHVIFSTLCPDSIWHHNTVFFFLWQINVWLGPFVGYTQCVM